MDNRILQALTDLAGLLGPRHIPFAIIGGVAVSLRGEPRLTADVDAVIGAAPDQALALLDPGPLASFERLFEGVEEVVTTAFILPMRHRKTGVTVDLCLAMSGFEQQLLGRATPVAVGGTVVPVATPEDLLLMKLVAGRPQDSQDARNLADALAGALDWEYLHKTARELSESLAMDLLPALERLRPRR